MTTAARLAAHWRHARTLAAAGHDARRAEPLLAMRRCSLTHLQQHRARRQRELDQDTVAVTARAATGPAQR
jgi:hypothetical protein